MYLEYADKLDKSSILSSELFDELFMIESEFERVVMKEKLLAMAANFGVKIEFENRYKAKAKDVKEILKNSVKVVPDPKDNCTEFSILGSDGQLSCGDWIADDNGVRIHTEKGMAWACPHPIFPTMILRNAETGQYKVEITFKVRGKIRRALVDRDVIASPTKILKLANDSIQVTSLNAPFLVQYLSDIEALNPDIITEHASTSRLGWIEDVDVDGNRVKKFLPYEQEVVFDNELNTKSLFDSIKTVGNREKWYTLIKEIRSKRQPEVLINIAASFASVLVEPCGTLPFIVSLWGGTGIGKTVILKIATSVWADPGEGKYITDAKATNTAMEIRLNILNSLPMTLDDMAQIQNQYDEDFSQLIYRWCAGKGRDRSNTNLGLNKLTSWRNCTITNGERSLVDESTQGGAVNRVIDIEASGEKLFSGKDGNKTCGILEKNFGYAGKEFIDVIKEVGEESINKLVTSYYDLIQKTAKDQNTEKEDKQVMPMALILAADELIESHLFKDGIRLNIGQCVSYLKNKGEVSEHKRAFEYLQGIVASNTYRFEENSSEESDKPIEKWGYWVEPDWLLIIGSVFDKILKGGNFQPRSFLSWAKKENLLQLDSKGFPRVQKKFNGANTRCVIININNESIEPENDGFMPVCDDGLPFD